MPVNIIKTINKVGTGGKSHYSTIGNPPTEGQLEASNTSAFGVLKMILHDTSYDWEFVGESGNIRLRHTDL